MGTSGRLRSDSDQRDRGRNCYMASPSIDQIHCSVALPKSFGRSRGGLPGSWNNLFRNQSTGADQGSTGDFIYIGNDVRTDEEIAAAGSRRVEGRRCGGGGSIALRGA